MISKGKRSELPVNSRALRGTLSDIRLQFVSAAAIRAGIAHVVFEFFLCPRLQRKGGMPKTASSVSSVSGETGPFALERGIPAPTADTQTPDRSGCDPVVVLAATAGACLAVWARATARKKSAVATEQITIINRFRKFGPLSLYYTSCAAPNPTIFNGRGFEPSLTEKLSLHLKTRGCSAPQPSPHNKHDRKQNSRMRSNLWHLEPSTGGQVSQSPASGQRFLSWVRSRSPGVSRALCR